MGLSYLIDWYFSKQGWVVGKTIDAFSSLRACLATSESCGNYQQERNQFKTWSLYVLKPNCLINSIMGMYPSHYSFLSPCLLLLRSYWPFIVVQKGDIFFNIESVAIGRFLISVVHFMAQYTRTRTHTHTRAHTHISSTNVCSVGYKSKKKLVKAHFGRDSGAFKAEAVLIMITFQCIH